MHTQTRPSEHTFHTQKATRPVKPCCNKSLNPHPLAAPRWTDHLDIKPARSAPKLEACETPTFGPKSLLICPHPHRKWQPILLSKHDRESFASIVFQAHNMFVQVSKQDINYKTVLVISILPCSLHVACLIRSRKKGIISGICSNESEGKVHYEECTHG
jgi:hypothetical protein